MTPELARTSPLAESDEPRPAPVRFHELDALRATAMLLGIVLHAAVFLIPGVWSTDYPDEASDFYAILFFAIHGFRMPVFGPDTSDGLIPNPVVLSYYALFFTFGAHFYQRGIKTRGDWAVLIIPALTVIFWPALSLMYDVKTKWAFLASAPLQAAYAWLMCFGLMGLFRLIAAKERYWVRYASDASYWIYLWHLPLILVAYQLMADWPIAVHAKFTLVCAGATATSLITYQLAVRYTPIGAILNGKRLRASR